MAKFDSKEIKALAVGEIVPVYSKEAVITILDKIKAEIEAKCCITVGRENDPAITLYDVLQIIDKYKGESKNP